MIHIYRLYRFLKFPILKPLGTVGKQNWIVLKYQNSLDVGIIGNPLTPLLVSFTLFKNRIFGVYIFYGQ